MSTRHLYCGFNAAPVARGELFLLVNHVLLACWLFQETLLERRTHSCFSHSHVSKAVDFISCWSRHRMLQSALLPPPSPSLSARLRPFFWLLLGVQAGTRWRPLSQSQQRQSELDMKVAFHETAAKQQQHSCSGINSNFIGTSVTYGDRKMVLMQNRLGLKWG